MSEELTSYEIKSRKRDFEQHAKKIYTAIRELEPNFAVKRAIWELFQNALDLSKENNTVLKISKLTEGLQFEHNGKSFDEDSLSSLIKQTSDKTFGDNSEKAGQYGTGFLTTHIYGKKFTITSSVQTEDNGIKILEKFEIDRSANSIDELIGKIQKQDNKAKDICEGNEFNLEFHSETTTFTYENSKASENYIDEMLDYVPQVLPYVFIFNEKLLRVEVLGNNNLIFFERVDSVDKNSVQININSKIEHFNFLSVENNNIKIILPQSIEHLSDYPKLFLYYPLIGTENLGFNFIIHCHNFKPNEKRNSIFLQAKNEELAEDVKINEEILSESFDSVKEYITNNNESDILPFFNIQFNDEVYLNILKTNFITFCKDLRRIKLNDNHYCSLSDLLFLNDEILNFNKEDIYDLYNVIKQFYLLPPFNEYLYLCNLVNIWTNFNFNKIGVSEILDKIEKETKCKYEVITDKKSYLKFIQKVSTNLDLLNTYKVIPNIHKEFQHLNVLKKWDKIEDDLVLVIDNISVTISSSYLLPDFYFLNIVATYTKENYKDHINNLCTTFINEIEKDQNNVGTIKRFQLIYWLNYYVGLNKITQTTVDFSIFLSEYYELPLNQNRIENPTSILQFDTQIKLLARLFIEDLKKKEVTFIEHYLLKIKDFVSILFNSYELKKNLLDKLDCFPSQSLKLRSSKDLKIDKIFDNDFKNVYNEILNADSRGQDYEKINIYDDLSIDLFIDYLQHTDEIEANMVGNSIEKSLLENKDLYKNVIESNNEILTLLLNLIDNISKKNSKWGEWLPKLNKEKEEILLSKFSDDKTRNSLFSILSKSPEKIQLLGELAEVVDLIDLINKGKEKQKEEIRRSNHLQHISKIGLQIQNLIETQLDIEFVKTIRIEVSDEKSQLIAKEEQNGQDFIIYKNLKPIYFIEVKSKWDENGRFALSKNQTEKCAKEKDNYAVITVNVERYKKEKNQDTENVSFDELNEYIRVNDNLGAFFEKLIAQNIILDESKNPKLIEFRGSIPQKTIDDDGSTFESFIFNLIKKIKNA